MKLPRISKCLTIALVLSLLFVMVFAQAAFAQEIRLSASQETGFVGETVTVKISITNALQTEGGQFDLFYGPPADGAVKLEPVSVSGGDFVPGFDPTNNANLALGGNKIRILWLTPEGSAKESGVICNVVFRIKEAGETPLTFSDWVIVDPLTRTVGTPTSGKVTGLSETAKENAIREAINLIDALPDPIDCNNSAHRTMVLNARMAVDEAKSRHGAVDSDFSNLSKLIEAEKVIAKCDAIRAADDAIYALPELDKLTLNDKSKVEEARRLVNVAKTQYGAVDSDFVYLTRLLAAENRIRELEGQKPITPPTGGAYFYLMGGVLFLVIGTLILKRRQQLAGR